MSLTYHDIPGARLCMTPATRRLQESASYVVPNGLIACVTGQVGVGKSTALRAALQLQDTHLTWVDLPAVYSPKELIQLMYLDIVGDPEDFPQRDLQDDLLAELATGGKTIAIANAERLTKEAAGQLEWLHSTTPGWAMYLVGLPATSSRIATEPHLNAALIDAVGIQALSSTELYTVLPDIHDMFFSADRNLIDQIDKVLKGNLGQWMKFLHRSLHISQLAIQAGRDPLTLNADLARAALAKMTTASSRSAEHR